MHKTAKYRESDAMSELVNDNPRVLLIMSRFGIRLGFGNFTIGEVCQKCEVDVKTFLAVVNMEPHGEAPRYYPDKVAIEPLLNYLKKSHSYFLDFRFPEIRKKLCEVVGRKDKLSKAIIDYYDEYVAEVDKHMTYEDEVVFPYVLKLLKGERRDDYNIDIFLDQHDHVEARLREFKNIIINYYPAESTNEINSVLFDIFNCEYDLGIHNDSENHLFVPAVRELERELESKE